MKLLILALLSVGVMFGQTTVTLTSNAPVVNGAPTMQAGASFILTETLAADGRTISAYQGQLTGPVTLTGASSLVAGKSASCNTANATCDLVGMNGTALSSNLLLAAPTMTRSVTIPASTPLGTITIGLANLVASDPTGTGVPISAGPSLTLTVTAPKVVGDLNGDGKVDSTDVGIARSQELGLTACTNGDLNGDRVCDVRDIQIVIHAAGF